MVPNKRWTNKQQKKIGWVTQELVLVCTKDWKRYFSQISSPWSVSKGVKTVLLAIMKGDSCKVLGNQTYLSEKTRGKKTVRCRREHS